MDLKDTPEQAEYRAKVRGWLEEHREEAPILRGPDAITDEQEAVTAHRAWQRKLAEAGLVGVQHRCQVALLLLLRAVRDDRGAQHPDADRVEDPGDPGAAEGARRGALSAATRRRILPR